MQTYTYSLLKDLIPYTGRRKKDLKTALKFLDDTDDDNYENWNAIGYDKSKKHIYHCCCGEPIKSRYIIEHKKNKRKMYVGRICIEYFMKEKGKNQARELRTIYNGGVVCSCGCKRKIRQSTVDKYAHMDKIYIGTHIQRDYKLCYKCSSFGFNEIRKYKGYDCQCVQTHKQKYNRLYIANMNESTIITSEMKGSTIYEPFGLKEEFAQLKDYKEICPSDLKEGDHYRYTMNKYRELDRKCVYGIVVGVEEGLIRTKGYMSEHPPWLVDPAHKYKKLRFYKRVDTK